MQILIFKPRHADVSFQDYLCYLYLVFVMLSCLVITFWESADLLSQVCDHVFVTFPCGILGQVLYLIVLIPDHLTLEVVKQIKTLCYFLTFLWDYIP